MKPEAKKKNEGMNETFNERYIDLVVKLNYATNPAE